jgi:mono/diheme cytochrome c family protein
MSTLKHFALCAAMIAAIPALAQGPRFGQPITEADIAPWDISIGPDGAGLPSGSGTARQGQAIYVAKCQACHGEKGVGGPNDILVGGIGSLAPGKVPVKTVGSYWPYATTLFDYIRRAMPFPQSKSMSSDDIYAVSAYILELNGIIGIDEVLDAKSLPQIIMPNRDGFVPFSRSPK